VDEREDQRRDAEQNGNRQREPAREESGQISANYRT